MPTTIEFAK